MKRIVFTLLGFFLLYTVGVVILNMQQDPQQSTDSSLQQAQTQEGQLQIEDVEIGSGTEARTGDLVTVHYTGTLPDGTKFDSSVDRGEPFEFRLGAGQVIPGWDQGIVGMKVGGTRKLVIPPNLGYGAVPQGSIPANSTLIFDVELLDVQKAPEEAIPELNL